MDEWMNEKKIEEVQERKMEESKKDSLTGNWTRVARVTGGNTHHYTIRELLAFTWKEGNIIIYIMHFLNYHGMAGKCVDACH